MDALKRADCGSSDARRERFVRGGFLSPARMANAAAAVARRERMERAEAA